MDSKEIKDIKKHIVEFFDKNKNLLHRVRVHL